MVWPQIDENIIYSVFGKATIFQISQTWHIKKTELLHCSYLRKNSFDLLQPIYIGETINRKKNLCFLSTKGNLILKGASSCTMFCHFLSSTVGTKDKHNLPASESRHLVHPSSISEKEGSSGHQMLCGEEIFSTEKFSQMMNSQISEANHTHLQP